MTDTIPRLNVALEGRYVIERELGEGGMAKVYLAQDVRHDRPVAIKVLRPELAAVIGGERFLAEIKTTANLQHPHILPLFDSGQSDTFLFYVMPLVQGDSLRDRIEKERQLQVDEAIRIAKAVASALDYAHRQGVIHRDIKPANILLQDGQPVVADFGIALAVSAAGGGRLTETGLSLGTPHYMSPEQATADRDPGPASDVYSLGCVLYEMLAGEPPFSGSSSQAILGKIITSDPTMPTEHRPTVPPHVEAAILRALEKLPADRFATAEAFADALDDHTLTHSRQRTAAATAPGMAPAWISQLASKVSLAAIAALVVWAGVVTLRPADPPPPRPVTRVVLDVEISDGVVVLSKDGRWLATRPSDSGVIQLRRLDQEGYREIHLDGNASPLAFSPDGRWLLLSSENGLVRVPVDGGAEIAVVSGALVIGADWSEDGLIVYAAMDGTYTVPFTGGNPELVLEQSALNVWNPSFLPGGRYVTYAQGVIGNPHGEIRVLDLETRETRQLIEDGLSPQYAHTGHLLFVRADQGIFAVPIDLESAEVAGPPIQVLDSVVVAPQIPFAAYSVSSAGTLIFQRGESPEVDEQDTRLAFVDSTGAEETIPVSPGALDAPRLSPDGRRLAYQRDLSIFVYDLLTGVNRAFTPEGELELFPVWSRDGSQIASTRFRGSGPAAFTQPADGSGPVVAIANELVVSGAPMGWTPDDEALLVSTYDIAGEPAMDLSILRLGADTTLVPYLAADWNEGSPALSPDGRWVAYKSDESGKFGIYVRSFPEPGPRHDISPPGGGFVSSSPVWARDGSTLFWRSGDSTMASDVTLDPDFEAGPPRLLFRGDYAAAFDVTEDRRFIMVTRPQPDSTLVDEAVDDGAQKRRTILVVNWFEELKERLGEGG